MNLQEIIFFSEIRIILKNIEGKTGLVSNEKILAKVIEETRQFFPHSIKERLGNFDEEELDDIWNIYKKYHNILTSPDEMIHFDASYKDELVAIILEGISHLESYEERYFKPRIKNNPLS
jgi:hypothetical protein